MSMTNISPVHHVNSYKKLTRHGKIFHFTRNKTSCKHSLKDIHQTRYNIMFLSREIGCFKTNVTQDQCWTRKLYAAIDTCQTILLV